MKTKFFKYITFLFSTQPAKRTGLLEISLRRKFLSSLNNLIHLAGTCPGLDKQRMRIDLVSHFSIRSLIELGCDLVFHTLPFFLYLQNGFLNFFVAMFMNEINEAKSFFPETSQLKVTRFVQGHQKMGISSTLLTK